MIKISEIKEHRQFCQLANHPVSNPIFRTPQTKSDVPILVYHINKKIELPGKYNSQWLPQLQNQKPCIKHNLQAKFENNRQSSYKQYLLLVSETKQLNW